MKSDSKSDGQKKNAEAPKKVTREDLLEFENIELKLDSLRQRATSLVIRRGELAAKYGVPAGANFSIGADGAIAIAAQPQKPVDH